jgi:hypothetical protein
MMHGRLKKIIFDKLYKDLSKLEIIYYLDSIWFIDRGDKYWYFEYDKDGRLYWRYDFFINYFSLFSLERSEFEPIMSEWVEEVLNCKVDVTHLNNCFFQNWVEEVLNHKVNRITMSYRMRPINYELDDVLNSKVITPYPQLEADRCLLDEVLNCKVNTTRWMIWPNQIRVEEVLNCKVNKTISLNHPDYPKVEDALNCNVVKI